MISHYLRNKNFLFLRQQGILFVFLFFCFFRNTITAEEVIDQENKQTICLNMIVKDEAHVICRCLDSVKRFIDYWVILDTGSTDGTQEIIKNHLKDIPGELHQGGWKNWGETRTEALDLAREKADYILFMDADDILEYEKDFSLPELTEDLYHMWRGNENISYLKPQIVRADLPWKWTGVTHEYLDGAGFCHTSAIMEGVHYTSLDDGATHHDPQKFWKNVKLLEDGLKKEPDNVRYAFYLAESYRCANEPAKAIEWYQKRVKMGGWYEEVFQSKLQIGHMLRQLGLADNIVIEAYKDAHTYAPKRIEGVYYYAEVLNKNNQHAKAYEVLKQRELTQDLAERESLFNEVWIGRYGLLFQLSIASYYVGRYGESLDACNQLLQVENLPEEWKKQALANREFPLAKLQTASTQATLTLVERLASP
jgi:glycosyltransferase involved in cell wall biosynthesis